MASAIICLADNQKFNFPKYIFDNMVKRLEGGVKFYLFPRFLQVFLDKQVKGMARHKDLYIISSHTKKIFANIKRIGAGFFGVITPLFDTMMVQCPADIGDTLVETYQTPIVDQPLTSKPQKKQTPRSKQRNEAEVSNDESEDKDHVPSPSSDPLPSGKDSFILNKLMVFYTSLQEYVLDLQEAKIWGCYIKLLDESQVLLKVPRQNNMYSFDLKNVVPSGDLTCLFTKAITDKSNLWHRTLGHINFKPLNKLVRGNLVRENKANVVGSRPEWLFDIYSLTKSMNYEPGSAGNQSNGDTGDVNVGNIQGDVDEISRNDDVCHGNEIRIDSGTYVVNAASTSINTASNIIVVDSLNINIVDSNHTNMPTLEATGIFDGAFDKRDLGAEADTDKLDSSTVVSPIPTTRVHKDHPKEHIIGDPNLNTQTRRMINFSKETAMVSFINRQRRTNHKDFKNYLFACFLSQMEPKNVIQALKDPSWIEAMQEKLLQFKLQDIWTLVDLPYRKRDIGSKWVFRNKLDERYFIVYQMDVKSAFLYRKIEEKVYVCQPSGFKDPDFLDKVYKVKKALYGLHQAPRAWYETLPTYLLKNGFKRGQIDKTLFIKRNKGDILLVQVYVDDIIFGSTKKEMCLQVKQKQDGIFISKDKYVAKILKKFGFSEVKTASTLMETSKPLLKDEDGQEVDVYIYRSMIGSLMYLTSSRTDIMFDVCACARHQVSPKVSYLYAVKRIFRYLKGQPKLGLWYPKDSSFKLEAYTDSDYAGTSLDRKSTTGECQFLSCRLISWQCKKQTVVANSTTEAEYVAASSCHGQVLWIQNQLLDYGRVKYSMEKDGLGAQEDASKPERMIKEIDQNAKIALDDETQGKTNDDEMFGVDDLAGEEVVMENTIGVKDSATPTTYVTEDEVTMAQALAALKKPKVLLFHKQKQSQIPTVSSIKDKGKAKMIELEVPIKRKEQMRTDKEYARKLESKEQEATRLSKAQQDKEANKSWDNMQAMMDANRLLVKKL
nr:hypothetical protein [Tanacetum cinerariifolium]